MSDSFNQTIVCVGLSSCCFAPSAYAQSNSKGENSSVVVGILKPGERLPFGPDRFGAAAVSF